MGQDAKKVDANWPENGLIFPSSKGTPSDPRNLLRVFKPLLKKADLPDIRFHDLRHTAATLMLLNGIPIIVVSRRLGHSKPSVTLDIYGHYLPGMQEKVASLMDELVTPVETKWQPIGNRSFDPAQSAPDLTANVAAPRRETATFAVRPEGFEPPTY